MLIPDHVSNVGHGIMADSKTVIPAPVRDVGHGAVAADYKTAERKKNVAIAQMEDNMTKVCLKHDNMVLIYQIFKIPVAMIVSYEKFCLCCRPALCCQQKGRTSLVITQSL